MEELGEDTHRDNIRRTKEASDRERLRENTEGKSGENMTERWRIETQHSGPRKEDTRGTNSRKGTQSRPRGDIRGEREGRKGEREEEQKDTSRAHRRPEGTARAAEAKIGLTTQAQRHG